MDGVQEVEVELGLEVRAALRCRSRVAAATTAPTAEAAAPALRIAEQAAEEVGEVDALLEREAAGPATTESAAARTAAAVRAGGHHAPDLVVLLALRRVTEDVVGRGDLLELLLGLAVPGVRVGVVLLGELAIRRVISFSVAPCGTPSTE